DFLGITRRGGLFGGGRLGALAAGGQLVGRLLLERGRRRLVLGDGSGDRRQQRHGKGGGAKGGQAHGGSIPSVRSLPTTPRGRKARCRVEAPYKIGRAH